MNGAEYRERLERIADGDALDQYSAIFGADREMLELVRVCPECDEAILVCDNGWLDAKAGGNNSDMGVMKMGSLFMMCSGGIEGGSQHRLHEHQPDDDR